MTGGWKVSPIRVSGANLFVGFLPMRVSGNPYPLRLSLATAGEGRCSLELHPSERQSLVVFHHQHILAFFKLLWVKEDFVC